MLLFWPLLGAAIGAYAAQQKGFSIVGGVIGGLLLGPLAFLLFFVTGVVSVNEQQRKCPYCAEWIRPEAKICKHCHKEVDPIAAPNASSGMSPILKGVLVFAALFFGLIVYVMLTADSGPASSSSAASAPSVATSAVPSFQREPTVTLDKYSRLQTGMSYQKAVEIIGAPGEELSRNDIAGITTVMYAWKNADGSNMNAMFQSGGLVQKAQFGLR